MKPVLIIVDQPGLQQFGFLAETHSDGRTTVFLPSSPNPGSGTTIIVCPERVQDLPARGHNMVRCMVRLGKGSGALLERVASKAVAVPEPPGDDQGMDLKQPENGKR